MYIKSILFLLFSSLISASVYAIAPIQHWQSSQGGKVYFVPSPGLPMVDIRLVFDAGSARDGEQHGIASLTASLLETGAGQWNADQLALRFDTVGAQLQHDVSQDYAAISLRTLTQADLFDQAVNTFQQVLAQPQFSVQDFQRKKDQTLLRLKKQQERPDYIAQKNYYQALYQQHPYAHLETGELETVTAIQLEEVKQFYQQYYVTNNAVLIMVGDLTEAQARDTAETLFKELKQGQKAEKIAQVNLPAQGKKQHIDFPSAQTHIMAGLPVLTRNDADYFPLYVGNHILGGGGLVSILFNEIREKRGLAYSAYSYFMPLEAKGPFTMGLQTQNKQRKVATDVVLQTLGDFIKQGPTDAELTAAKKNITGGFVLRFDNNRKLLDYVAMIAFYQLPLDYLQTFQDKVLQVSVSDIKSAFQRRIKAELLQIISVGGQ